MRDLRKDLKELGDLETSNELRDALNEAAQLVVDESRANASTRMEQSMASRLKASKGMASAAVSIGGKPYDLGAEFGAKRWPQFKEWRGNGMDAGYVVFPTIRAEEERIVDKFGEAIDRVLEKRAAAMDTGAPQWIEGLGQLLSGG